MDTLKLAREISEGRRLRRGEELGFMLSADLGDLSAGADILRKKFVGDRADLCSIINGKSGRCPENCRFCAQSARNQARINEYGFLGADAIVAEARRNSERGVDRFAIVTAGRSLSGEDFEKAVAVFKRLSSEVEIGLCASFGLLTKEQFQRLKESGVTRYHCNIETSRRNFPNVCTTHSYDDKIENIRRAQAAGLEVCSGGIIGMGETWEDRLDMALDLSELGVASVPLNALTPIPGTPFGDLERISEEDILRTVAIFRYILPEADVRLAAGRNLMKNSGEAAFLSGANSAITGDMLTTSGNGILDDVALLNGMGFSTAKTFSKA